MIGVYISYFKNQPLICISVFVTLIPIIFILYRRAIIDPSFLILFIYLISKLIIELIMYHEAALSHNTLIYFNLSSPLRYSLLSGMFYYKLELKRHKRWIIILMISFIIFSIWDMIHVNPDLKNLHDHQLALYSPTVECLLIIFWILIYFYDTIRLLKIPNLLTFPFFWVCSGLLINYSSFVFIAPVLHYTQKWSNPINLGFMEQVPYIFEIICTLFISTGVWLFSARYYARQ